VRGGCRLPTGGVFTPLGGWVSKYYCLQVRCVHVRYMHDNIYFLTAKINRPLRLESLLYPVSATRCLQQQPDSTHTSPRQSKLEISQSLGGLYDGLALPPPLPSGLSRLPFCRLPSPCPLESPPLVDIDLY